MRHPTKHLRFFLASLAAAGWLVAALSLTMSAAFAQGAARDLSAQSANIYAGGGGSLSAASGAGMAATVANFLATKGHGAETLASLVPTATHVDPKSGVTHLKFGQEVAGLGVYGTYVKAAIDGDGNLIHLIENLAELSGRGVAAAAATPRDALNEAMIRNHPGVIVGLVEGRGSGNVVSFSGGGFFHRDPTVTRVAIAMENGPIKAGFLVETWTNRGNMLHHTLVGGAGGVLGVELRTNNDSYNIFTDHPGTTSQAPVSGPGAGNTESPKGWLRLFENGIWDVPPQTTVDIIGNNANAYLDAEANNSSDGGGSAVTGGVDSVFGAIANLSLEPDDPLTDNPAVAVQNLFYFNNLIHDKLYLHGFIEGAGNFQEDNFGKGGNGSDSVNAEAQDGSGTDNANFSTPSDGSSPRMQMFLWTPDHEVVVAGGGPTFSAKGAEFGPSLDTTGIPLPGDGPGDVVIAVDGGGFSTTDGCEALINGGAISGNIALIDRGDCAFVIKVKNAQVAGAIGVIVANNVPGDIFTMGGTDGTILIPSVFIGLDDGGTIKDGLPASATIRAATPMRDGDVDSDIIWHEYGHGLTWRMIGNMSGDLSGAIGEGMSDVLSILANGNDVVGEYSFSNPIGIRSAPYTDYPRTYGDMGGSSVHFDGEIYAATIWRLWELFQANSISKDTLYDYLVGGMNFTPAGPAMEDMRDGILQAAAGSGDECLIWRAFADFGIGVGAEGIARGGGPFGASLKSVTESTTVPAACSGDLVLAINAGLTVAEGTAGDITDSLLLVVTTVRTMTTAGIVYTVKTAPANGVLLGLTPNGAGGTFTQAEINAGSVSYAHGGGTDPDSFVFTVSDGDSGSIGLTTFNITVTGGGGGNTAPVLAINDGLTVANGAVGVITNSLLLVTDADNPPSTEIVYTVTTPPENGSLLGLTLGTFTQADIDGGSVSYGHDGTATTTDSFEFTVSDGAGGSIGPYTFNITVTAGGGGGGGNMHVGDLDATTGTDPGGSSWFTTVTITVHDSSDNPLAGATVSVGWTGSGPGQTECPTLTDEFGKCTVSHSGIKGKKTTLTVNNITLAGYTYDAAANHDPDVDPIDSDGTAITVPKPPMP